MTGLKLPHHHRYDYHPIDRRQDYSWPGGKRLAFYIAFNIEHFAFGAGLGLDPQHTDGRQTHRNWAWRDYGNRVGIWNLLDVLEELGLPATMLMNSTVCDHYPELIEKMIGRGDDILGHGRTGGEVLSSFWESDEARIIQETTDSLAASFGAAPTGWMGPGCNESRVTPDLLKEAGYEYLLDWPMDDQPVWMRTRSGQILSVPYPMELNDAGSLAIRDHTGREFGDMIVDQFEELLQGSAKRPLVFALSLHAFIVGQPFRLKPLREALRHCVNHPEAGSVWFTTAGAIAKHCFDLPAGTIAGDSRRHEPTNE
ncbi:polysaccharide deacetylase family protein [Bradyrhizobium sp. dw_411]|uniref:polysaccharide deacetylase family protein n=1 Tax=Bradyrhizobium sp. dw_411 TaxID=2720082 RepID=UPI0031FEC186